jgi:hypothetical protein
LTVLLGSSFSNLSHPWLSIFPGFPSFPDQTQVTGGRFWLPRLANRGKCIADLVLDKNGELGFLPEWHKNETEGWSHEHVSERNFQPEPKSLTQHSCRTHADSRATFKLISDSYLFSAIATPGLQARIYSSYIHAQGRMVLASIAIRRRKQTLTIFWASEEGEKRYPSVVNQQGLRAVYGA